MTDAEKKEILGRVEDRVWTAYATLKEATSLLLSLSNPDVTDSDPFYDLFYDIFRLRRRLRDTAYEVAKTSNRIDGEVVIYDSELAIDDEE